MTDLVHGMGTELVAPDWTPITPREAREVLAHYGFGARESAVPAVVWRSPRPMSAAALVRAGATTVFVKRHHVGVRSRARLEREHEFARHLRVRAVSVPEVLVTTNGESVLEHGDYVYEVHHTARGVDAYRDVPSWYPFASVHHAVSAGRALALFHQAARDFAAPACSPGILSDSMAVVGDEDPEKALMAMVERRAGLARGLARFDFAKDFERWLVPGIAKASPFLRSQRSQWTHGDWHASNLTWSTGEPDASVSDVLDLGLANRTTRVRDLAIALERNCVDWLDINQVNSIRADHRLVDGVLDGYEEVLPLDPRDKDALVAVLPVSHIEFALSEIEYFAEVVRSEPNTTLAYEGFLLGHVRWFEGPLGSALLTHVATRA
ncbi:MAG: phosphotransferase enzyme family protein [Acidimicrobiales bacterium]